MYFYVYGVGGCYVMFECCDGQFCGYCCVDCCYVVVDKDFCLCDFGLVQCVDCYVVYVVWFGLCCELQWLWWMVFEIGCCYLVE